MKKSDLKVVTKAALWYKIGKWRVYDVVFMTKRVKLLTDHEIKPMYKQLFRVTDKFFIGLTKKEQQ